MPSEPQPQPQPSLPAFTRIFHALDSLKTHTESLQQYLELTQQQQQRRQQQRQPYQQTRGYPPGPPPAYGLPPASPTCSPALVLSNAPLAPPSRARAQGQGQAGPAPTTATALAPRPHHPHVYGHGSQQQAQLLAQIDAARDGIGAANAELDQAIAALRRSVQGVVHESTSIGSKAATGTPSLAARHEWEAAANNRRDIDAWSDNWVHM